MAEPWTPPWTSEGVAQVQVLILGPPEAGKSYLAARVAPMLVERPDQIVVVGPPSAKVIADDLTKHYGVAVPWVKVSTTDREEQEAIFRPLLNSPKHQLIVIDEFDTIMTAGGRSYGCLALNDLVQTGRSLGKALLCIAHDSTYIAKQSIQNCNLAFISRSKEVGILRYAKAWMCYDIDEPDALIAALPKHVFLMWAPPNEPAFLGFARATESDIDFLPPEALWPNTQDPSKTSENDTAEPESAGTAATADESSPTGASQATAGAATRSTGPKPSGSPNSDAATGSGDSDRSATPKRNAPTTRPGTRIRISARSLPAGGQPSPLH